MMLPYNPRSRGTPTYDLERIQQLVGQGELSYRVTTAAYEGAKKLSLDRDEIVEAVLSLTPAHFYKSMESEKIAELWQDVYHLEYRGTALYLKLQINQLRLAVIIQFKRK